MTRDMIKKKKQGFSKNVNLCYKNAKFDTKNVCATLKTNDTTSWRNCSTNIDPGAKNDKTMSKQNL